MLLVGLTEHEEECLRKVGLKLERGADSDRWDRLEQSYISTGLWSAGGDSDSAEFCCSRAAQCARLFSSSNGGGSFPEENRGTVANYFAAGYDRLRTADGTPVRVCVASMDSGGWTKGLYRQTELDKLNGLDFRNPHWRETRKLLHFLYFGEWTTDLPRTMSALKLFTHVRALKCNGGTSWNRNGELYEHCLSHLKGELRVLEPTIIIAQGYSEPYDLSPCTTRSIIRAMDDLCRDSGRDILRILVPQIEGSVRLAARVWKSPWGTTVLLGADHPRNVPGYSRALREGLRPAINILRQRSFRVDG